MLENRSEYALGDDVMRLSSNEELCPVIGNEGKFLKSLSKRERALRFNGFVVADEHGKIVFEDRKRYAQHFFPLSIIDYAKALYAFQRRGFGKGGFN